jgi:hypothetical protein
MFIGSKQLKNIQFNLGKSFTGHYAESMRITLRHVLFSHHVDTNSERKIHYMVTSKSCQWARRRVCCHTASRMLVHIQRMYYSRCMSAYGSLFVCLQLCVLSTDIVYTLQSMESAIQIGLWYECLSVRLWLIQYQVMGPANFQRVFW